jgi:hypothetical protein
LHRPLLPLANDLHCRNEDNPVIALLAEIKQKIAEKSTEKKSAEEAQAVAAGKEK